jgi:hypothetical protein
MATTRTPHRTTVGSAMPVSVPPRPGYWRGPTPGPAIPQQRRPDGDSVPSWPAAPDAPRRVRRLTRRGIAITAFAAAAAAAVGLVLLQPSDDRAVSRSTGLTELMVPPALTAAEPVPEQPLSLAEMLLGRGPDAADLTDLEELLLRPGPRVFSPAAGDASEPSWWIVLRSGTEQPQ